MTHNNQKGFTLVELVVVLAILSILAAVAVPKYVSHVREARMAALSGLAGSIRSAVMLVQSKYVSLADYTATTITMTDGSTVNVSSGPTGGIPVSTAGGIDVAIKVDQTFTYTADPAVSSWDLATPVANCKLTYTAATGAVQLFTGGC